MHKYENMHARRLKIIGGNPALYTVHVILMHEKFMRKGYSENLRNSVMISKRFSITGILSFLICTFIGKSTNSTSILQLASPHLLWIICTLQMLVRIRYQYTGGIIIIRLYIVSCYVVLQWSLHNWNIPII